MNTHSSRLGLQLLLAVVGTVALVAGTVTIITGTALIPEAAAPRPSVDSELRFFAAWYAAAGIALLSTVARVETRGAVVGWAALAFLAGGCARIVSWIAVGRPSTLFVVLMALELGLPVVIVPWQRALARP